MLWGLLYMWINFKNNNKDPRFFWHLGYKINYISARITSRNSYKILGIRSDAFYWIKFNESKNFYFICG